MSIPFMKVALSLADLVPSITRWFSPTGEEAVPVKDIANRVVDIAKKVTQSGDAHMALEILKSNPEALINFQKEVLDMDRDLERAFLSDRHNARMRDMAFLTSGRYNFRADIMVLAAAAGLLACLVALGYYRDRLPGEAVGIISTIAGIFGSCLKDAYSFEFGSSRGSKAKDLVSFFRER